MPAKAGHCLSVLGIVAKEQGVFAHMIIAFLRAVISFPTALFLYETIQHLDLLAFFLIFSFAAKGSDDFSTKREADASLEFNFFGGMPAL